MEEEAVGEVVRVGPVGARAPRSFLVGRRHPLGRLVVVELEKPWGLVFEEDPAGAAVVGDVVEGSAASRRNAVAKLRGTEATDAVLPGDVPRACTAINFVYGPGGLAGVAPPQRTVVLFGADGAAGVAQGAAGAPEAERGERRARDAGLRAAAGGAVKRARRPDACWLLPQGRWARAVGGVGCYPIKI